MCFLRCGGVVYCIDLLKFIDEIFMRYYYFGF